MFSAGNVTGFELFAKIKSKMRLSARPRRRFSIARQHMSPATRFSFRCGTAEDAATLAALHTAVAEHSTSMHRRGPWSTFAMTETELKLNANGLEIPSLAAACSRARTHTIGSRASFREYGWASGTTERSCQRHDFSGGASGAAIGWFVRSLADRMTFRDSCLAKASSL